MSTTPDATDPVAAESHDEHALQRGLTSAQISMIGLSGALGTGLFLGSGSMIKVAGPGIIVSYTLCGILALAIVFALAEMTVKHPEAGGFGASAHAYLGPLGGWIARWNVAVTMCIAVGAEVVASASYLTFWWPQINLGVATVVFSLILVAINVLTVKIYGASEYWFSIIKVIMVVVFILLGLIMLFIGLPSHPATGLTNLTAHGGFAPNGWSAVLVAAVMAIFSFGGAENVSLTAAESADPESDIPRAARAMVVRLVLFYVGAIAIVVALEPWTVSATADGTVASSPFVRVLDAAGIPFAAGIMNFILITAAMSSGNGCLYASTRMLHSLARHHMAPAPVGRTTSKGAPANAVMLAALGMIGASALAIFYPKSAFQMLFGVLIFGLWFTWVMIMVTYMGFKIRRSRHNLPPSSTQLPLWQVTGGGALLALIIVGISLFFIKDLQIAWIAGGPYLVVMIVGYLITSKLRGGFARDGVLAEELAAREAVGE